MIDTEVSLLLNGSWVNAAAQANYGLFARDPIQVSYGRANWSSRTETGRASFTLDNRDGRWSPDNPTSPNFGVYKRNIPVRIGVGAGDRYLGTTGVGADLASTPDISGGGGGSPVTPVVASVTSDSETSFVTTHTFSLPATVSVGDRLLLVAAFGHDSAVHTSSMDPWTIVYTANLHGFHRFVVYEIGALDSTTATALAGSTVQFTTTSAAKSSCQVLRITGARSGGINVTWAKSAGVGPSFGTAPDSDSLTAPWGATANLFLSLFTAGSTGATVSANPSGYTAVASGNASSGVIVGSARKASSLATDDPGAFTINDPENWQALTMAYQPVEVTNTDGVLDIAGDIDMRIEFQLHEDLVDIDHGGSRVRLAHKSSGANGWEWELYAALGNVVSNLTWRDSGGVTRNVTTEATGAALPLSFLHGRSALRVTLDVNNGAAGHTVTWYHAPNIAASWTQLGSAVVVAGTTSIKTNDAALRVGGNPGDGLHIPLPGKLYAYQLRNGLGGTIVANPAFTSQAVGATSFTDSAGRLWSIGTGGRITNLWWRFHGELASLPVRWDVSGHNVWAPVEAAGLFRRLRQGNRRLESAIRRAIIRSASNLVQYWPMEDTGDRPTLFGPAVGTAPLAVILGEGPAAASNTDFLASSALPAIGDASWAVFTDAYPASSGWQVRWLMSIPAGLTGTDVTILRVATTDLDWRVRWRTDGSLAVNCYRGGTSVYDTGWIGFGATGKAMRYHLAVTTVGSNVSVQIIGQLADGSAGVGVTNTAVTAGVAGQVSIIQFNNDRADLGATAIGHVTLQSAATSTTELATELSAYDGERAGDRIMRLCREEGIATRIEGDPADTEAMGPQRPGTLIELLEECADTDLGVLHEARDTVAVGYRTRVSMTDQTAKIALDYAAGEVAGSLELDRDDQDFANDVTVENWSGASARAVLDDGTDLSVSEPPVGAGRYDQTYRVSGQDNRLAALAASRLALTAVNEPRVSKLSLALHHPTVAADPSLVESILDASLGDLVTIDNALTVALGATQVRQLLQGTRDSIGPFEHQIDALTSPASPWESGDIAPPPEAHSVHFRTQQELATAGTPPHVLTVLGYTSAAKITRADLDGILDDWVTSTGGTTRTVTSSATWTSALAAAVPGDLIRVTTGFTADLNARGNKYGISGSNLTASPAGGLPGQPIILTCANGVTVTGTSTSNNEGVLDIQNVDHLWPIGFNTSGGQFGIRCQNWGGSAGFPAYRAYCSVLGTGHSGFIAQGWFQLITLSGGTPPAGTGNEWGFSQWFVDEENFQDGCGLIADAFGESYYYGRGSAPGWVCYAKDFWHRGNEGTDFTADGIDLKPGCHRFRVTDNRYHTGYCVFGAPMTINYCSADIDARPAWMAFDVEGYMEGNRVWDINITSTNGSSANIGAYSGLSGLRWYNNLFWGIKQTGFTGGIYIRNEKGTDDTTAVATFRTDPTIFVNNLYWGTSGAVVKGGYGAGAGFPDPYPVSVVFTERNNVAAGATGAQFVADSADFIATVPAVAAAGDAEWLTYGPGSAFDLALTSDLIGAGTSITDLTRTIGEDITQRDFAAPPAPGPFQAFT